MKKKTRSPTITTLTTTTTTSNAADYCPHHISRNVRINTNPATNRTLIKSLTREALFLLVALSALSVKLVVSEPTKEFDWSDIGVALTSNPRSSLLGSSGAQNNLRIVVSPQRRQTKSYEFDYTNSSQPIVSQNAEPTYLLPGSSAASNSHSSAYSALSASIASLKSRLNARGVNLGSSLPDNGSSSFMYTNGGNTYSLTSNNNNNDATNHHHQQQQQQQQIQLQQQQPQAQQPTYLSVTSNHQEPQAPSGGAYNVNQNQNNDNKTIVLAIPAKINFLTENRSTLQNKQQQQQQQPTQLQQQHQSQQQVAPQLTVVQSTSTGQNTAVDYSTKQLGLIATGQDGGSNEQLGHFVNPVSDLQEHQQYVIVNSPTATNQNEPTAQLMTTTQLGSVNAGSSGPIYSSIYPATTIQQSTLGSPTAYAFKYIPTFQQAPTAMVATPVASLGASGVAQPANGMISASMVNQGESLQTATKTQPMGRYSSCLDTCNPMDHRWRKYSLTKFKYCCSRSSQFDSQQQFTDFPVADKVSEMSYKYADDAYYNYLYRRSRNRRSRRPHRPASSSNRYHTTRYSSSTSSQESSDDEREHNSNLSELGNNNSQENERGSMRQREPSRSYQDSSSAYMKYYKSKHPVGADDFSGSDSSSLSGDGGGGTSGRKSRFYRQGRSNRNLATQDTTSPIQQDSTSEEDTADQPSGRPTYGANEYSVSDGTHYSSTDDARNPTSEDDEGSSQFYDENSEPELGAEGHVAKPGGSSSSNSDYTPTDSSSLMADQHNSQQSGEFDAEPESMGHFNRKPSMNSEISTSSSSGGRRRKQHGGKSKTSKKSLRESFNKYLKKNRNKNNRYNKMEQQQSSQYNSTGNEMDSVQPGGENSNEQTTATDDDQTQKNLMANQSNDLIEGGFQENKHKSALNDSTVANLSKTTMHLKEILSILEKKAHSKLNESTENHQQQQSTPAPFSTSATTTTTTAVYPPSVLNSQFANALSTSLQNGLSSTEYLTSSDFSNLKSPYRFDPSSISSSGLALSPSSYSSLSIDPYSSFSNFAPNHYAALAAAASTKHIPLPNANPQRKRRPSRNMRQNYMIGTKPHSTNFGATSHLLHAASIAAKNPFLNSAYYSMHNPYWYNRGSSPVTSSYPFKNHNRNNYHSMMNSATSPKGASSTNVYSDKASVHQASSYDPLTHVASSLRPSTTMRLRPKPFVFQPNVLPVYTRHTILSQPVEVK